MIAGNGGRSLGRGFAALAMLAGVALLPAPAQAGFFEQLFGMEPAPQPQPTYRQPEPGYAPQHVRPQRRRVHVEVIGSGKQTPSDLMHDKTLRAGDAVMMKDGVHVYAGGSRGTHDKGDFVPLAASKLSRKDKLALATVDAVPANEKDDGAATGRSAAVGTPPVRGKMVTDARGRKVRYIGP